MDNQRSAQELWEQGTIRAIRLAGLIAGVLLILYGAVLIVAQIGAWLRFGRWSEIPITTIFWVADDAPFPYSLVPGFTSQRVGEYIMAPAPGTWLGLRSVVLWLMNLPLALGSFLAGAWLIGTQATELEKAAAGTRPSARSDSA